MDTINKLNALYQLSLAPPDLEVNVNENEVANDFFISEVGNANMVSLKHYAALIIKTDRLCSEKQSCVRLKNMLLNFSSSQTWEKLVEEAYRGQLNQVNILLKSTHIKTLKALIHSTVTPFYAREIQHFLAYWRDLPTNGFLIKSEQNSILAHLSDSHVALYNINAQLQWVELQRLANLMYHIPFIANGMIVDIKKENKEITQITLRDVTQYDGYWYYQSIVALLVILTLVIINLPLTLHHICANYHRMAKIKYYYDTFFNRHANYINNKF